jgi:hypothetical protein
MSDRIWQFDFLLRNLILDPHTEDVRKNFTLELVEKEYDGFKKIKLEATKDLEYKFDAVGNAEAIFLVNTKGTTNIWYRINGLYENIPLASYVLLTNGPSWGQLDRLFLKSTNQDDDAEILVLILGVKEKYNGNGNP